MQPAVVGIDIGSVSISLAAIDPGGHWIESAYAFHLGDVAGTLKTLLPAMDLERGVRVAVTGAASGAVRSHGRYDSLVALIAGCRRYHDSVGSILHVGGRAIRPHPLRRLGTLCGLPDQQHVRRRNGRVPGSTGQASQPGGSGGTRRRGPPEHRPHSENRHPLRRLRQDGPGPRATGRVLARPDLRRVVLRRGQAHRRRPLFRETRP